VTKIASITREQDQEKKKKENDKDPQLKPGNPHPERN